jgi:hypothetical protein
MLRKLFHLGQGHFTREPYKVPLTCYLSLNHLCIQTKETEHCVELDNSGINYSVLLHSSLLQDVVL